MILGKTVGDAIKQYKELEEDVQGGILGKKKSQQWSHASHVITIPSIKATLTNEMVQLQKFKNLGSALQKLKHWRLN